MGVGIALRFHDRLDQAVAADDGQRSIPQDDAEKGVVHLQTAVVFDESNFPKLVHEKLSRVSALCAPCRQPFPGTRAAVAGEIRQADITRQQ